MRFGKRLLILSVVLLPVAICQSTPSLKNPLAQLAMSFGQFAATTQFYLYGRKHCTRTGWENARKQYPKLGPDFLAQGRDSKIDLSKKVFMVTGANGGIGREITSFLAANNATVYMVCRSAERGLKARDEVAAEAKNEKVHLLLGDCSLEKDVRRVWEEFTTHRLAVVGEGEAEAEGVLVGKSTGAEGEAGEGAKVRLDALVCNAGALSKTRSYTPEGVETTFAAHLLFGTYLLGNLAMPTLTHTDGRLVVVSSGGMYNGKFPSWETATNTGNSKYDGQFAYVHAKRGQVLLCERWAEMFPRVKVVSCHPGWVKTEGVADAYGADAQYLEPLRSLWEGTEGILWLCLAPLQQIQGGAFYLDRKPQVKHLAGPFFSEGSYTKNSPQEVDEMMSKLEQWSDSKGGKGGNRPTLEHSKMLAAQKLPLQALKEEVDIKAFMGVWNVLANIPSMGEVGATNCVENYSLDKGEKAVQICFQYAFPSSKDSKGLPLSPREMRMRGNLLTSTHWTIDPKVWGFTLPIGLNYLLLHVDEAEGYCMVGVPDRSYLWIMTRDTPAEFKEAGLKVTDVYDLGNLGTERQAEGDFIKHEVERDSPSIAQQAQQAKAKKTKEGEVLKRAVKRASELGYDVDKIQRCMWFEADREGKGEKTGAEGEKGGSEGDKGETGDLAPAEPVAK